MCSDGGVKATMYEREGGKDVQSILLGDVPVNSGRVAGSVTERTKDAFD